MTETSTASKTVTEWFESVDVSSDKKAQLLNVLHAHDVDVYAMTMDSLAGVWPIVMHRIKYDDFDLRLCTHLSDTLRLIDGEKEELFTDPITSISTSGTGDRSGSNGNTTHKRVGNDFRAPAIGGLYTLVAIYALVLHWYDSESSATVAEYRVLMILLNLENFYNVSMSLLFKFMNAWICDVPQVREVVKCFIACACYLVCCGPEDGKVKHAGLTYDYLVVGFDSWFREMKLTSDTIENVVKRRCFDVFSALYLICILGFVDFDRLTEDTAATLLVFDCRLVVCLTLISIHFISCTANDCHKLCSFINQSVCGKSCGPEMDSEATASVDMTWEGLSFMFCCFTCFVLSCVACGVVLSPWIVLIVGGVKSGQWFLCLSICLFSNVVIHFLLSIFMKGSNVWMSLRRMVNRVDASYALCPSKRRCTKGFDATEKRLHSTDEYQSILGSEA